MFHVPESARVQRGHMGSDPSYGNNGLFDVRLNRTGRIHRCVASDGMGWEHVSVSLPDRCPTWGEMDDVKRRFWDDTDMVIQYHVPRGSHVNNHNYCLHLWRRAGTNDFAERPPSIMV